MHRITFLLILTVGMLMLATGNAAQPIVRWLSFSEAEELARKEPRKFFVDMYTNWCGWCKKMDATTFSDSIIANYLNKKYYPVKFNAEQRDTIFFAGKSYTFIATGNRGFHELAVEWAGERLSFPTIIFLDEYGKLIQAIPGYRNAQELHAILVYFGDNYYRMMSWDQFKQSYHSPFPR